MKDDGSKQEHRNIRKRDRGDSLQSFRTAKKADGCRRNFCFGRIDCGDHAETRMGQRKCSAADREGELA